MFNIKDFLKRASGRQAKELFFRQTAQGVIKRLIKIEIPIGSIVLKNTSIHLNDISQAARSAIFIKKQEILAEVNKSQDFCKVNDVR